ncbi:unnamed protein product [Amaranthus hypochondriacus]
MRLKWMLWKNLKSKETGLGWDHEKGTVNASDEWWSLKIQENPKFESFKDEGIKPELEIKMDQVFGGCAQGVEKFTPVADPIDVQVQAPNDDVYVPYSSPYNAQFGQSTGYEEVSSNVGNDEWDTMWR